MLRKTEWHLSSDRLRFGWGGVTVGVGEWVMFNLWRLYVAIRVKR